MVPEKTSRGTSLSSHISRMIGINFETAGPAAAAYNEFLMIEPSQVTPKPRPRTSSPSVMTSENHKNSICLLDLLAHPARPTCDSSFCFLVDPAIAFDFLSQPSDKAAYSCAMTFAIVAVTDKNNGCP